MNNQDKYNKKPYNKPTGNKPYNKDAAKKPYKPKEPKLSPTEASVRNNDIEQAMRILKNKMAKENILGELRKRKYFEKPSEKKRRKKREALRKEGPAKKKPWVKRSRVVASVPIKKFDEE